MKDKTKQKIKETVIGGIAACVVAIIFFGVNYLLGADRPFILRLLSVPAYIPLMLSKPLWPLFWPNEYYYILNILGFSLVFYFIIGGLLGLLHSVISRRKFYSWFLIALAVCIAVPTGLYISDMPKSPQKEDYYQVEYSGVSMPLWVRGRADSGVMILHVHGGPGDTAIRFSMYPSYRQLESKYAVAYWDQPGAGSSRGLPASGEVSMGDVVKALDTVIDFLHEKYPNTKLYLLGHSFGGEVGTKYLTEYPYQNKVDGWIEVDGAHNEIKNWGLTLGWLEQEADRRLQEGNFGSPEEKEFWEGAAEYVRTHRDIEKWNETILWDYYIERAGGYGYSPESAPALGGIPQYMLGRANFILERVNLKNAKYVYRDAFETDYTPLLKKITLPTLLLWGRHDHAVSVQLAMEAYENIGTEEAKKDIVIFEQSGHNPMLEEPDKFAQAVITFVEKNAGK